MGSNEVRRYTRENQLYHYYRYFILICGVALDFRGGYDVLVNSLVLYFVDHVLHVVVRISLHVLGATAPLIAMLVGGGVGGA